MFISALRSLAFCLGFGVLAASAADEKSIELKVGDPAPGFEARTYADTPDIDCEVRVKGKGLCPGDFVKVKVTAADGYDLAGRAIGRPW